MNNKDLTISCVLSGIPGYFKLRSQHNDLFEITGKSLKVALDHIIDKLPGNVIITGLFNAYTEEIMARRATEDCNVPFTWIFDRGIYGDSGGLQMVTLGKGTVEKEDRLKIYKTQSTYANYALSFDEIPAKILVEEIETISKEKEPVKTTVETRYYLPDLVEKKAEESGYNLKEQIDFFKEVGTDCKIIPIIQGWGVDDTSKFAKGLFGPLTAKDKKALTSLATGFASTSLHASAQRMFDVFQADYIPNSCKQHIHLLGVTGFKRLIPVLQMAKLGFMPGLKEISFDSVTLTMSYVMGGVVQSIDDFKQNKPKLKLGTKLTPKIKEYWAEIYEFWKDAPDFGFKDLDDFIEHSYYNSAGLKTGFQQYEHYIKKDEEGKFTPENKAIADEHFGKVLRQEQYYILYNVYKYVMILEEFLEGNIALDQIFSGKDLELYTSLEKVKTASDFEEWRQMVTKTTGFKIETMSGEDTIAAKDVSECLF